MFNFFKKKEEKDLFDFTFNLYSKLISPQGIVQEPFKKQIELLLSKNEINKHPRIDDNELFYEFALLNIEVFGLAVFHNLDIANAIHQSVSTQIYFRNNPTTWEDLMEYSDASSRSSTYVFDRNTAIGVHGIRMLESKRLKLFNEYAQFYEGDEKKGVALCLNRHGTKPTWKSKKTPIILNLTFHERIFEKIDKDNDVFTPIILSMYNIFTKDIKKYKWI